jgi:hypothetical protein
LHAALPVCLLFFLLRLLVRIHFFPARRHGECTTCLFDMIH